MACTQQQIKCLPLLSTASNPIIPGMRRDRGISKMDVSGSGAAPSIWLDSFYSALRLDCWCPIRFMCKNGVKIIPVISASHTVWELQALSFTCCFLCVQMFAKALIFFSVLVQTRPRLFTDFIHTVSFSFTHAKNFFFPNANIFYACTKWNVSCRFIIPINNKLTSQAWKITYPDPSSYCDLKDSLSLYTLNIIDHLPRNPPSYSCYSCAIFISSISSSQLALANDVCNKCGKWSLIMTPASALVSLTYYGL